ncbi:MAG: FecR domain-containing protein [Proteobacteria bacterium]|nr:FecR domain-containing protein [Pseudomonadota bacterium]
MVVRRSVTILVAGTLAFSGAAFAQTGPSGDPPARVGRLSYLQGTVSYHDAQADAWSPAAVNTPLTTGDSVWTEPNGHDELSISGTRVRMDGDTQLDVAALDDSQTRLQLDQGRLDIKTFALDTNQPYQIVTPRGIAALKDQGDYYVHAGTTADPTVMGVRSGAADFQAPNGQTVALHSGEEAQVTGDGDSIQIRKVETAPPPLPTYWAQRDQRINYAPVQYLGADVTGYEDLAAYGTWTNDPDYGEVWVPQAVAADWTPYSTGYWSYVDPYGWTWVDSAPWGFAPYHYGRWAHRDNRWFWVPPERREHAVYAPALVAFVGGTELGAAIGAQNRRPVGWFPLGPREAYVPPYTADRHYYQRINANARVPEAALNDRWQRAEHHEALRADQHNEQLANRRFATVVSADDFSRSRPVQQARLHVAADKIAAAPVAAVSAPPAPTMALAAQAAKPGQPPPQAQPVNHPGQQPGQPAVAKTRFAAMETIARPAPNPAEQHHVPGPRITSTQPSAPTQGAKPNLPQLAPHGGNAAAPNQPHPNAAATPQVPAPNRPGEPPRPNEQHPGQPPQANQAVQPEHRPGEPPRPSGPPQAHQVQPQHPGQPLQPGETPHPQANQAVPPAHPGEPPRPNQQHPPQPPQVNHAVPAPHQPEPPHPQANHAVQPPHQPEPPHPQANVAPQHPAEPPHPAPQPQAHAPAPPPQHQAPPPQAHAPAPPPQMPHPAPQAQAPHPAPPPAPHPSAPPPQAPHPAPQQAQQPHPAPQSQQPQQQQKKPGEK